MTYQIFKNVLSKDEIQILLDFYHQEDDYTDDRIDVRSKTLIWNKDNFPQEIIEKALNQVLGDAYEVEAVYFLDSRISFRLHADSGRCDNDTVYKNILFPLAMEGLASTILFDNHYYGASARFSHGDINPFRYNLPNHEGTFIWVDDIRDLLRQCQEQPDQVKDFDTTPQFIQSLEKLVADREKNADRRVSDYHAITNWDPAVTIDDGLYQTYLYHMPKQDVDGLTIAKIYQWNIGDALTFPRSQLHCAGAGHKRKIGLSIFTRYRT